MPSQCNCSTALQIVLSPRQDFRMLRLSRRRRRNEGWMRKQSGNISVIKDPRPDDIIIPIMGPSGVGKSTFINTALVKDATVVGHSLLSCTAEVVPIVVPYPGDESRRIVFVDTPGFDDTFEAETKILDLIAQWLAKTYRQKNKIAGILYLYDISQKRMLGSSRRNLSVFENLCGKCEARNIILVTTMWSEVKQSVGRSREEELFGLYWKPMADQGSRLGQYRDTYDSAWEIVASLVEEVPLEVIQIQKELIDLQKLLPETEAGKALRNQLRGHLEEQKARARRMLQERTPEAKAKYKEMLKRLNPTLEQVQELNIPLSRRLKTLLFRVKISKT